MNTPLEVCEMITRVTPDSDPIVMFAVVEKAKHALEQYHTETCPDCGAVLNVHNSTKQFACHKCNDKVFTCKGGAQ